MMEVRRSEERGHARHGWLDSRHTFSFANYYDPRFTGFRDLVVVNEDRVQPGAGFGKHPHRDMEIISYVLEGALAHEDSMGSQSVMRAGDVQRMSAGSGIMHSEFNHSREEQVHFLQIWITPREKGIEPGYEEKRFSPEEKRNRLRLIVSPSGEDGSLHISQDVRTYATLMNEGAKVSHELNPGRHAWIQVARGSVELNGITLEQGDGAAISEERMLTLIAKTQSEVLVFDLP